METKLLLSEYKSISNTFYIVQISLFPKTCQLSYCDKTKYVDSTPNYKLQQSVTQISTHLAVSNTIDSMRME